MPGTLTPTPDQPRPDLLLSLPALRARLEEQRQFRIEQIASLAGTDPANALSQPGAGGAAERSVDAANGVDAGNSADAGNNVDTAHGQVTAALLAGARQALADIDTALYRINNGEYGNCLECGAHIGMQRLRTLPQTALCADCHRARGAHPDRVSDTLAAAGTGADPGTDADFGEDEDSDDRGGGRTSEANLTSTVGRVRREDVPSSRDAASAT
ncbi:MAG TPA: TraR/DksA C4-type zinc finger protein [Rugosimonospora sp.]